MESLADFLGVADPTNKDEQPAPSESLVEITDPSEFCRRVLNSREFRQYVLNGIVLGDIPPAVLCRVIDHAWGKPAETVKHEGEVTITKVVREVVSVAGEEVDRAPTRVH